MLDTRTLLFSCMLMSTSRKPSLRSASGIWHLQIEGNPPAARPPFLEELTDYKGLMFILKMGVLAQKLSLHHFYPMPGKAGSQLSLGDSSSHEELVSCIVIQTAQAELMATCPGVPDTVSKAFSRLRFVSEFTQSWKTASPGQLDKSC